MSTRTLEILAAAAVLANIVLFGFLWSRYTSSAPETEAGRTLCWDASSAPVVKEYRIYIASRSGEYDLSAPHAVVPAPATEWIIEGLPPGDFFAVVTAASEDAQSPPSAEVEFRVVAP